MRAADTATKCREAAVERPVTDDPDRSALDKLRSRSAEPEKRVKIQRSDKPRHVYWTGR
jgi:hypothetical protein